MSSTSHGGILYYVVRVPKEQLPQSPSPTDIQNQPPGVTSPLLSHNDSTDSGWDNPFRPDGDLSREADEIVELIKGGKPITPTAANGEAPKVPDSPAATGNGTTPSKELQQQQQQQQQSASPAKGAVNGKTPANGSAEPGQVDVKRATVSPSDASQVERVKLNKKPKCKCCVIQ